MSLNSLEEYFCKSKPCLSTALDVELECIVLLDFLALLSCNTLMHFVWIFHVFLTQIGLKPY